MEGIFDVDYATARYRVITVGDFELPLVKLQLTLPLLLASQAPQTLTLRTYRKHFAYQSTTHIALQLMVQAVFHSESLLICETNEAYQDPLLFYD